MEAKKLTRSRVESIAVFLFLLSIVILNQTESSLAVLFYYAIALVTAFLGLFPGGKKLKLPWVVLAFAVLVAVTGVLNVFLVGNSTLNKQLYTLISIGIALVFLHRNMEPNVFLAGMLVNAAVVLVRFMVGSERFYISSSANFVSVHVLLPVVIYYSLRETQGKRLVLWPAAVAWIMCLLAQGRGGILFGTFLLGCLLLYAFCKHMAKCTRKARIIWCGGIACALVVLVVCTVAFDLLNRIEVLARFARLGLSDNGRFPIWKDYITAAVAGIKPFVLGADASAVPRVVLHGGNVHNSFLNIQLYNGGVALIAVAAMMVHAAWYAIRRKKVVYLICFATLCLRGATDFVFWGTSGTPFFLFFLLMPAVELAGENGGLQIDFAAWISSGKEKALKAFGKNKPEESGSNE